MKTQAYIVYSVALGLCQMVQARLPNDTLFQYQWPLKNTGGLIAKGITPNKIGADMHMEQAWDITTGDSSIIVAILDSGCKWKWPDLAPRIWINKGEIAGNGLDDDGNGFIDDMRGWDFYENDNDPDDIDGHGTSVASIIGSATDNTDGFAGVDWKCKLMVLRDGSTYGLADKSAKAIRYAIAMKARVINISQGVLSGVNLPVEYTSAIADAIQAGIVVVAGVGNAGTEGLSSIAELPGVISVGATGPNDYRAKNNLPGGTGSNYGSHLDLVAPGEYVPALDVFDPDPSSSLLSGTSYSTPNVVGVVSLLLAQDPRRTPAQIRDILCSTADDLVGDPLEDTQGRDKYHGYGRVNAFRALSQVGALKPLRARWSSPLPFLNVYTVNGRRVVSVQPEPGMPTFGYSKAFGH